MLARPDICLFKSFSLLMWPFTGPLLHSSLKATTAACRFSSKLFANALRRASDDRLVRSSRDARLSVISILLGEQHPEFLQKSVCLASRCGRFQIGLEPAALRCGKTLRRLRGEPSKGLRPSRMCRATSSPRSPRRSAALKSLTVACTHHAFIAIATFV